MTAPGLVNFDISDIFLFSRLKLVLEPKSNMICELFIIIITRLHIKHEDWTNKLNSV